MKIGLMGCEFVSPNKGCEALTYSIIGILNKIEKVDSDFVIYNYSGTGLGLIENEFQKLKFIEVKPKLKDLSFKYIKSICKCDIVLDATMGDSFSDIYSEKYFKHLIRNKRIAELFCKNYVLLPQTYGPFNSKKTEKLAQKVFKKAKKIYCRDNMSKELLENKFNINNPELATDMAFLLPYKKDMYSFNSNEKIRIGFNISGLLYRGGFHSTNQFNLKLDYKDYVDKIIKYFSNNQKYEVHIIPHVIDLNENAHDDDYKISQALVEKFNNCILAPVFNTPIEAKSYISNMDVFIGSRMHSTIAAFSSGVITIPVSYSRKFEGLFNSLNYEYGVNGRNEDADFAYKKTINYVINNEDLKNKQIESQKIIEQKKEEFINSLKKVIDTLK